MQTFETEHYLLHYGANTAAERDIEKIAALLNEVLFPGMTTTVLLETMTGKGSEVGGRFEELRAIIDRVQLRDRIGVCLDTCHVWDAGYDIAGDLDGVLAEFDRVIGLERLHAVHLNNSLNPCGSHKDRHPAGGARARHAASGTCRAAVHPRDTERRRRVRTGDRMAACGAKISGPHTHCPDYRTP